MRCRRKSHARTQQLQKSSDAYEMDSLAGLALPSIARPQLVGILCGCGVFVGTILTVIVLLVSSGSVSRLKAELAGDGDAPPPAASERPRLVDVLLEARKTLPRRPDIRGAAAGGAPRVAVAVAPAADAGGGRAEEAAAFARCADGSARFGDDAYAPAVAWLDGPPASLLGAARPDGRDLVVRADGVVVGRLRLERNAPADLSVRVALDWLHPAHAPGGRVAGNTGALALAACLDALFSAGYRRVEALPAARDGARRSLYEGAGFALEGVLRKYAIVDERSRDGALYAVTNADWRGPGRARAFAAGGGAPPPPATGAE